AFMNSSGHRANILNSNYTTVGIGVAYDSAGNVYVVQDFIK
ncbi:CAP domain-containing protein, partial [Anaerospora hongkongensis]